MTAIYKRELKSLFSNVIAYIFIAFMLCVIGFFAKYYNFDLAMKRNHSFNYFLNKIMYNY